MEDLAATELFYESLFAGVELVCDALRERDEFDEEEVKAGYVQLGVDDVVFGNARRVRFGHGGSGLGSSHIVCSN